MNSYAVQNISSAKVEKPCSKMTHVSLDRGSRTAASGGWLCLVRADVSDSPGRTGLLGSGQSQPACLSPVHCWTLLRKDFSSLSRAKLKLFYGMKFERLHPRGSPVSTHPSRIGLVSQAILLKDDGCCFQSYHLCNFSVHGDLFWC